MKQTYTGGCHCGAVRYQVDMDLKQGTIRCNCSICSKARAWLAAVGGNDFRLLQGAEVLSDYQFGNKRIHHLFCKNCGIKSFGRGLGADGSEFIAVLVNCLDDVPPPSWRSCPSCTSTVCTTISNPLRRRRVICEL